MKIKAIKSYLKKMELTKPYTIAYNTYHNVNLAFLEIELENGIIGYGSGSPADEVVGETTQMTLTNLKTDFLQQFVGRDIRHFQQLIYEAKLKFNQLPGTQATIDIALHDAFGKFLGIPIVSFYGKKIKSLPTSVTIGIKNLKDTLEEANNYKELGFKVLKVKTGINVEEDIERIAKLNERYGNTIKIRVDANQGYTVLELKTFIDATKNYKIELIEQPLKVNNEKELLNLSTQERSLIAADESLKDSKSALQMAVGKKPFGVYNIKLMKCGGLMNAKEIAMIAQNASIDLFWGCNDESIISITAALHAAYSCPNTKYIDLDGSFDLAKDLVTGGFSIEDGVMKINNNPGFGFNLI
jgi:L-alanine-DL-glutamate epimerase-like enolase superfamily enzyme